MSEITHTPSLLPIGKAVEVLNQMPQDGILEYQGAISTIESKETGSCSVVEIKVVYQHGKGPEQSTD